LKLRVAGNPGNERTTRPRAEVDQLATIAKRNHVVAVRSEIWGGLQRDVRAELLRRSYGIDADDAADLCGDERPVIRCEADANRLPARARLPGNQLSGGRVEHVGGPLGVSNCAR
jgi:hypothetical protein